jgi:hypothetical protein
MNVLDAQRHARFHEHRIDCDDHRDDEPTNVVAGRFETVGFPPREVLDHCPRCDRSDRVSIVDGLCPSCTTG